jgi:multiple sugar transport system ATP-binding protein
VILGLRPEHLVLGAAAAGAGFDARVEVVEQLGSEILLETRVGSHSVTVARVAAETPIVRGDQVRISAQPGRLHFFDPETELPVFYNPADVLSLSGATDMPAAVFQCRRAVHMSQP